MLVLSASLKETILDACSHLPERELNRVTRRGISPFGLLLLGCEANSLPLMEEALKAGADVNGRDAESWTPLMHGAYHNHREAIAFLIDRNARIHCRSGQGESAVLIARREGNREALALFDKSLYSLRLKHAGILIEALKTREREGRKAPGDRDKLALALSYIDRAYVWWVGEEHPRKVMSLFKGAYELVPRLGAFPYASILAASGRGDEALDILEEIQRRGWTSLSRQGMADCSLFLALEGSVRWQKVLSRWPESVHFEA